MRIVLGAGLLLLSVGLWLPGCATVVVSDLLFGGRHEQPGNLATAGGAGALEPDLSALKPVPPAAEGGPYYALTPLECQCIAARNSTLGNMLDGERRALANGAGKHRSSGDQTKLNVLSRIALEAPMNRPARPCKSITP